LLDELQRRGLTRQFDLDDNYPYTRMLRDQIAGRNSSWAVRWHAACFLKGLLTLYPGRSLVENIGNDSSGMHCDTNAAFSRPLDTVPVHVGEISVEVSNSARSAFARFLAGQRTWQLKLRSRLRLVMGGQM